MDANETNDHYPHKSTLWTSSPPGSQYLGLIFHESSVLKLFILTRTYVVQLTIKGSSKIKFTTFEKAFHVNSNFKAVGFSSSTIN